MTRTTAIEFRAPWSRSLKRTTWFAVALLGVCGAISFLTFADSEFRSIYVAAPIALAVLALLLSVRGYSLSDSELTIKRLGWNTRLSLADLKAVDGNAEAISNAKPLLTYGGVFAYVGFFWHSKWKLLRVRATDPSRAVVLTFARRRFVITPHDPQQFIVRVRTFLKARERGSEGARERGSEGASE